MLYLTDTIISPTCYSLTSSSNDVTKKSLQLNFDKEYQWLYQRSFNENGLDQLLDLKTNEYKCLLKGKISRILTDSLNYTFDIGVILVNDIVLSLCSYKISNVNVKELTFNETLILIDKIKELKYIPYKNKMIFTMKVSKSDTYTFNDFGFDIVLK